MLSPLAKKFKVVHIRNLSRGHQACLVVNGEVAVDQMRFSTKRVFRLGEDPFLVGIKQSHSVKAFSLQEFGSVFGCCFSTSTAKSE